jgi:maltokinase
VTDETTTHPTTSGLDVEQTADWLHDQRWYASKSRGISALQIDEDVEVSADPAVRVLIAQARFATGAHELYQLPISLLEPSRVAGRSAIAPTADGRVAVDAVSDPELARALLSAMAAELTADTPCGCMRFRNVEATGPLPLKAPARPMGVEQSNSSIVFGEETVLKVFRRVEPGINPELEVLRFLTAHGFPNIAPLRGWYEYEGRSLAATLGVAQRFLAGATGGWELALQQIRTDPAAFINSLGSLGRVTAQLHNALASDPGDPAFSPEEPSAESLSLLVATIDEDVERIFTRLPEDERVAPILGRGQDVREHIAQRAQLGVGGRAIRTHGDYHLGQTLYLGSEGATGGPGTGGPGTGGTGAAWSAAAGSGTAGSGTAGSGGGTGGGAPRGWVIIDFEGEPARPLFERRQKASPLRDVAGMLRSFAYATSAVAILHGRPAPGQFEDRARQMFLEQYFTTIEPSLLPAGEAAVLNLLTVFELEKAVYELRYELDNRPDWLPIPVAGIARLLEAA